MPTLRSDLDKILAEKGAGALLLVSESFKDANMYYLTKLYAPDPFILIKKTDQPPTILVHPMEFPRAKEESIVKDVRSYAEYDFFNIVRSVKEPTTGFLKFIATVAEKEIGKKPLIAVPQSFQALLFDYLRDRGFKVKPFFDIVEKARETKDPDEIKEMTLVQRATERATSKVIDEIANTKKEPNGTLTTNVNGRRQPLTVGRIKAFMGHVFIDENMVSEEIIVSCGSKSAIPHYFGEPGDKLKANQPIIMDIFPVSLRKRYGTDMTRTVVKGKASKKLKNMYETVLEARGAVLGALHAGVLGSDMYNLVCDVFEKAGYDTTRGGKQIEKGFTHGLGHGVGLSVHEGPGMGETYKFPLKEHAVVTVEPGLYDPKIGGVRIEDIVEVTKRGCRNLTKMPIQLEV
jgi:Xaa-Pro aminopeptidase